MDSTLTAALSVGFVLGMWRATDAQHVAAISTFVSEDPNVARSWLLGTFWGIGHTLALLAAGVVTLSFRLTIPPHMEQGLQTLVGFVLMLLGGHVLLRAVMDVRFLIYASASGASSPGPLGGQGVLAQGGVPVSVAGQVDSPGVPRAERTAAPRLVGRAFLVGLVHGLAGSAALILIVLTTIPDPLRGLLYILVFGLGSTAGMLILSGLIALPFAATAARAQTLNLVVRAVAGTISVLLGAWIFWTASA
jgi:high-affinity nickel-transport protein